MFKLLNKNNLRKWWNKKWIKRPLLIFMSFMVFLFCLPVVHFNDPYSTLVEAKDGSLLGAQIASDGQWRFAAMDTIPYKFKTCLIAFEDQYFYFHIGFNPFAIVRAISQDLRNKRVVSGASTITMQVVRMSRNEEHRVIIEKVVELFLAMRLELAHRKNHILSMYVTHAPFGGNVVGLEAASWRYYGCSPQNLSWGEAATLAVLPNAPALIYPGKNSPKLRDKRNRLLARLRNQGIITSLDYKLACLEDLPEKPAPLPHFAPHLVNRVLNQYAQQRVRTTIDINIQQQVVNIVKQRQRELQANHINNVGVLVLNVETGAVVAYVGNTSDTAKRSENDVDMIRANRSSGSILKPFLYGKMLDEGHILPHTLLRDVPVRFGGYSPKNYTLQFDGAVPASEALSRSLNIPALFMLKDYGIPEFQSYLKSIGFTTFNRKPENYGLSLILGGGEINLWELCGAYSSWARILKYYADHHQYNLGDIHKPYYNLKERKNIKEFKPQNTAPSIGAGAIWWTFEAMKELKRPIGQQGWKNFSSSTVIAWKTGTSYGFRDAWAVGVNPRYTVGVWVGNADGEGRPGITGITAAAPILFDVFGVLGNAGWFEKPLSDLLPASVCQMSGYRASPICPKVDTIYVPAAALNTLPCPYHRMIHLDKEQQHQVTSACYDPQKMIHKTWFVLTPIMEWFYKQKHYDYKVMPPWLDGCAPTKKGSMQLQYPEENTSIYVPIEITGKKGYVVFKAANHNPSAIIYWHIDDKYIGQTQFTHNLSVQPTPGKHLLTLVDNEGTVLKRYFTVLGKP